MANINIKTQKILSPENIKRIISLGISLKDSISALENKCIEDYDATKTYAKNTLVIYNGYIYKTKTVTTGDFNENKFEKIGDHLDLLTLDDIKAMINMSDEEIANLQSLILDTSIELSHTWSSSKIYGEIQNAIKKGEAFTLSKLASTMTASFEVATSISDIKEGNILYLLNTGTNTYDIYALISGTPTKIASTTIDLSQYAKLTDLNDYLKKTDADGKYATITTVDSKVDKTSILSAISSTPSDDKLLSEKAIKSELDTINTNLDDKVNKASITTTIDSSSTDTQVPSAKSVWDNIKNKNTMQPSGTMAKYSTVFDWAVNNVGATCPYEGNNLADCPLKNTWGTLVCIGIKTENGLKVLACSNFNENIYIRTILRRNGTNEWVEPKWKRLCSTSVADVPKTQITLNNGFTGTLNYEVKNGVCYVNINGFQSEKTGQSLIVSETLLPKPSINVITSTIHVDTTDAKMGMIFIDPNSGNKLKLHCYRANAKGWGTFSYTVAES